MGETFFHKSKFFPEPKGFKQFIIGHLYFQKMSILSMMFQVNVKLDSLNLIFIELYNFSLNYRGYGSR